MVTVPAPKTYKLLSIALNGSNMVSLPPHDICACTAWTSLHRLDLRHLLPVPDLVQPARLRMRGCTAALADENMRLVHAQLTST